MSDIPADVAGLVAARDRARAARDFAEADALREQIEAAGYRLRDGAHGATVERAPSFEQVDPRTIRDELGEAPAIAFSFHVLYEGYPADLRRFLDGFAAHNQNADAEIVIVDAASADGEEIEAVAALHPNARLLHLDRDDGWAAGRNAGLKTSRGALIVLVDLSIEPVGDICTPLRAAFDDPSVGLAGPFGLVSEDMRSWHPSGGPDVHAIEGYLLAARRDLLAQGLIREKFRWYRNADIDLSFQLRASGARGVVVDLPVRKHAHRGWEALGEEERDKRSRKNHYLFFDRWKTRQDLLGPG